MVLSHVAHGCENEFVAVFWVLALYEQGQRELRMLENRERALAVDRYTEMEKRNA
jgi:hypothetical protein